MSHHPDTQPLALPRLIAPEDERDMLIYAFRYCLGRQTYATRTMQQTIHRAWPHLSVGDRRLIQREIRERQEEPWEEPLGHPNIDKPGWLALLKLPTEDASS